MQGPRKVGANACCRKGDSLPSLFYFDAPGRAQPARFCFLIGGVEFRDVRFPNDSSWTNYWKQRSPTGQAPWLEVDGAKIPESRAIMMYAARKGNLIPTSQEYHIHCEMILDMLDACMKDAIAAATKVPTQDKKAAYATYANAFVSQGRLGAIEHAVQKYQCPEGFIVGSSPSYADAFVASMMSMLEMHLSDQALTEFKAKYPAIQKCKEAVYKLDVIKDYVFKYPSSVVLETQSKCCESKVVMLSLEAANINYTITTDESTLKAPVLILNKTQRVEGLEAITQWINNRHTILPMDSKRLTLVWELVQSIRDICTKYAALPEGDPAALASQIDTVDGRLGELNCTEGATAPLTVADMAASVLYEALSMDNRSMTFATSLRNMAEAYNRVYLVKGVKLGFLTRSIPTLYYFNIPGKAESCRWLLHISGVPFNDQRYSYEEWTSNYKSMSPTGQCPMLKIGDEIFVESLAIVKMIGDATDFVPYTPKGKLIADCVAASYQRCINVHDRAYALPEDQRRAYRIEHLPAALDVVEKVLQQMKTKWDWIVENRLTWVDVYIAAEIHMSVVLYKAIEVNSERWPTLTKIYEKVRALPQVQAYEASLVEKK